MVIVILGLLSSKQWVWLEHWWHYETI